MPKESANRSKLTSVTLEGYKSIGTRGLAQTLKLSDITIMIGANGSGKSNFVSFFKMLNHMMTGALQLYVAKEGAAENFLHFGSKYTPVLSALLEFENETDCDTYAFSLVKAVRDTLIFSEEYVTWNDRQLFAHSGGRESYLTDGETLQEGQQVVKKILSSCRAFQFHDTSNSAHIRNNCLLSNDRYLMSDGGNLAAFLYRLKSSERFNKYYQRIVERIRFMMPQFGDFVLEPQEANEHVISLKWVALGDEEYTFGAEQLSDGAIRFMALATLFLQPPELLPQVIILDEPELGLHPRAIDMLAYLIRSVTPYSQVIVATQSPRLLDNFGPENVTIAEYDNKSQSSVYRRLSEEDLSEWLAEYTMSQLWEKNVIGGQP